MRLIHIFIHCLILSLFVACDITGKSTGANDRVGGFLASGSLTQIGQGLSGVGSIVSSNPVGSVKGARSFRLRFKLDDGGALTFVAYSNATLLNGVEIEFQRRFSELEVIVKGGGFEHSVKSRFTTSNASGTLDFMIDVHNDHDDATHLFIWPYLGEASGTYGVANALVNSDFFKLPEVLDGYDFYDWHDDGVKGQGAFWGLRLNQAEVLIYRDAAPKDNS